MKSDLLWEGLLLRPGVKEQLAGVLQSIESGSAAFNILIFGPPGTGKTDIIRRLARWAGSRGVRFVTAGARDFRAGYIGQAAMRVRSVFEKVRGNTPAILFIDLEQGPYSDDCLLPSDPHERDSFTDELLPEVLLQMDLLHGKHPPVFIIGETFHIDRVHPAVIARFDIRIEIPLPSESERREILEQIIRTSAVYGDALDVKELSAHLARSLPGASGRYLNYVVRTAIEHARKRSVDRDLLQLTREDLLTAGQESGMYVKD
jgi:SpoVK/Ycf46/Vps4 family AAA+-type ATPase